MIYKDIAGLRKSYPSRQGEIGITTTGIIWRYVNDARALTGDNSAPADDGLNFLATLAGGNTRWFRVDVKPYVVFDKNNGGTQASGTSNNKITWAAKVDPFGLGDLTNERFGGGANGVPLGTVRVYAQYQLTATTDGNSYASRIYLNGADAKTMVRRGTTGGGSITIEATGLIQIAATSDTIEFYCDTQDSRTISDVPRLTFMEISYTDVTSWRE